MVRPPCLNRNKGEHCLLVAAMGWLVPLQNGAGCLAVVVCERAAWSFLVPVSFFKPSRGTKRVTTALAAAVRALG